MTHDRLHESGRVKFGIKSIILTKAISILFTAVLLFAQSILFSQSTTTLHIGDPTVTTEAWSDSAPSLDIPLVAKKWTDTVLLFSANDVRITAQYQLRAFESNISQHKDTGVQMKIRYTCDHLGAKEYENVTRIFYLNDDRTFSEKQDFVFDFDLQNKTVEFTYSGSLPK